MQNIPVNYTARDAKTRFGEMLDQALGQPVSITRHDRPVAYVVSKRDYDALLNRLTELEDQLWLTRAEAARNEGYATPEEVNALLARLGAVEDEVKSNETGVQGIGKPGR